MNQSKFSSIVIVTVVALVICLTVPAAEAADILPWVGGDGNFSDVYNGGAGPDAQGWDYAHEPTTGLLAHVTNGATVTIDKADEAAWVMTLGTDPYGTVQGEGHLLVVPGGEFRTAQFTVSNKAGSVGSITQTGGSVTVYSKSGMSLGSGGSNGTYTISGGELKMLATNYDMHVGRTGTGTFNIIGDDASIRLGIITFSEGAGADATLDLDIDAGGISPIEIVSGGHAYINNGTAGTRTLDISLSAAPPAGDLVLLDNLGAGNVLKGTFDGLPEGAPVQASFGGKDYSWNISYAYGPDGNDIALTIPEPSTLVLLGLVGLIGCGRRSKRRE